MKTKARNCRCICEDYNEKLWNICNCKCQCNHHKVVELNKEYFEQRNKAMELINKYRRKEFNEDIDKIIDNIIWSK